MERDAPSAPGDMKNATSFEAFCAESRRAVEMELGAILSAEESSLVNNVARYATLGGGHRWRALLLLAVARLPQCRAASPQAVLRCACAMEIFHSASLLLDDLPSMDDATLRRGRKCAHLVFPRWAVDMAPSYLVTLGYDLLVNLPGVPPALCNRLASMAARASILMCRGQESDLLAGTRDGMESAGQIVERCRQKTGALFRLSAMAAAVISGTDHRALGDFGESLGTAYQLADDLGDAEWSVEFLGKEPGQDADRHTVVNQFGNRESEKLYWQMLERASDSLQTFQSEDHLLESFTRGMMTVAIPA